MRNQPELELEHVAGGEREREREMRAESETDSEVGNRRERESTGREAHLPYGPI
jgi:hypothetical protein